MEREEDQGEVDVGGDGRVVLIATLKAAGGQDPSYSQKELPPKPEADFPVKGLTS